MQTRMLAVVATVLLSVASVCQSKDVTVVADTGFKPVTVKFSCTLPADDPLVRAAKIDQSMQPSKIVWLWGDEPLGAKSKNFATYDWEEGTYVTHTYNSPGNFAVYYIVTDRKNRLIKQGSVTIKVQESVKVEP